MYQHLLLATDGSELAQKAVAQGLELAKALVAKVTILTVTKPWPVAPYDTIATPSLIEFYEKTNTETAATILAASSEVAKRVGVACATLHVKDNYPAQAIVAATKEQGCDMASHGRGTVRRLLLGSEALKVLTLSTVPVLICR